MNLKKLERIDEAERDIVGALELLRNTLPPESLQPALDKLIIHAKASAQDMRDEIFEGP